MTLEELPTLHERILRHNEYFIYYYVSRSLSVSKFAEYFCSRALKLAGFFTVMLFSKPGKDLYCLPGMLTTCPPCIH